MEKLRNYLMQVSNGDKKFTEEMIKNINSYVKNEAPKSGSTISYIFGTDIERVAKKNHVDLSTYFNPGDLDVFKMEVCVVNGKIDSITCVDAPRKTPVSL